MNRMLLLVWSVCALFSLSVVEGQATIVSGLGATLNVSDDFSFTLTPVALGNPLPAGVQVRWDSLFEYPATTSTVVRSYGRAGISNVNVVSTTAGGNTAFTITGTITSAGQDNTFIMTLTWYPNGAENVIIHNNADLESFIAQSVRFGFQLPGFVPETTGNRAKVLFELLMPEASDFPTGVTIVRDDDGNTVGGNLPSSTTSPDMYLSVRARSFNGLSISPVTVRVGPSTSNPDRAFFVVGDTGTGDSALTPSETANTIYDGAALQMAYQVDHSAETGVQAMSDPTASQGTTLWGLLGAAIIGFILVFVLVGLFAKCVPGEDDYQLSADSRI